MPPKSGEPAAVLIVDDEPGVAEATAKAVARAGPWRLVVTTSARRAMDVLASREIAVVLADLAMPEVDGAAVLEEAARRNPATVGILVTGQASKDALVRLVNSGCIWKCMEKPWRLEDLRRSVAEGMRLYSARCGARQTAAAGSGSGADARKKPGHEPAGPIRIRLKPTPKPSPASKPVNAPGPLRIRIKPPAARPGPERPRKRVVLVRTADAAERRDEPSELTPEQVKRLLEKAARYREPAFLKRGGAALVFRAHDSLLDIPVAIKVPAESLSRNPDARRTLVREAGAAMQLSHKHMVRLHDIHPIEGLLCLVMEYIDGGTLRDVLLRDGPIPVSAVCQVLGVCADVLDYAHRHEVLHRDIKPDNLMLRNDGILKIIDFGLAGVGVLGRRKHIRGTPFYVSPEEVQGRPLDGRADQYSLAVTVHELLTGALPVPDGQRYTGLGDFTPRVSNAVPAGLRPVLERAMARDPAERWPDTEAFSAAFNAACGEA